MASVIFLVFSGHSKATAIDRDVVDVTLASECSHCKAGNLMERVDVERDRV